MKILKEPDLTWSHKFTCNKCCAELEAETTDLHKKHYSGDMREPSYDSYYVICPRCQEQKCIPENDIPKAVRNNVKTVGSSSW